MGFCEKWVFFGPLITMSDNLSLKHDGNVRGSDKGKLVHDGVSYGIRGPILFFAPIFWSALVWV